MLEFDSSWRFDSPGILSPRAVSRFRDLIDTIGGQQGRWRILEHFKRCFARAAKSEYARSSDEGWASSDLDAHMRDAAENAPLFIEAFYVGCSTLRDGRRWDDKVTVPKLERTNRILHEEDTGYQIEPPRIVGGRQQIAPARLVATREPVVIPVPEKPPSLEAQARAVIDEALQTSERFLNEGRGRHAVQEVLWLLESVSTAFQGKQVQDKRIEGEYFNKIVKNLRQHGGEHQPTILTWMTTMHGYFSGPKKGGIRHGIDLKEGREIGIPEARLFCNLIRSYVTYLIDEHERLTQKEFVA